MSHYPPSRELVGSPHVDSPSFRVLSAVRGEGPIVHFVNRALVGAAFPAFCGAEASPTERGTVRWRIVSKAAGKVCQACHAASLTTPSRIDWRP